MTAPARPIKPRPANPRPRQPTRSAAVPCSATAIVLPNEAATRAFAAKVASVAAPGDAILLDGALGSGKTTFARHFLHALGEQGEVPSPTFTLVQIYETAKGPVWHVDLYRLEGRAEVAELGLEEAFAEAISLIEWPDRLGTSLPPKALRLCFSITSARARQVRIEAGGSWERRLAGAGT